MKKLLLFITIFLLSQNIYADDITGEMIYAKKLKRVCGVKGDILAKKYTAKKWTYIYNSGQLNDTLQDLCPKLEPIKQEHLIHLYEFFYKYAKDSDKKPLC
jgi:hypothetical protein